MVLVGHAQRLATPLTGRQRWLVGVVVAAIVAVSLWAALRAPGAPTSSGGCVRLVVASSTGGNELSRCGAAARAWCATEYARTDELAKRIQAQCVLAGIPRGVARHPVAHSY
jgi:hypothetical protein